MAQLHQRRSGLRPLGELFASEFSDVLAGWIPDRRLLLGRRYGAVSNAALAVGKAAVAAAGWRAAERKDAWVFVGSSRGNAGELFGAWPERRPIKQFRASNLMHSEIASALSIELGIRGPWHVLSNGCASGLDALGFACWALQSGTAPRALVVAVDLPLIPELLHSFRASGILSGNGCNDPYSTETTGFLPGEAAVAVTLERPGAQEGWCSVEGYSVTSDAFDSIGLTTDGQGMAECMSATLRAVSKTELAAVCPHATGTRAHAVAETAALEAVFPGDGPIPCTLLKPYTGHTLGASGLVDVALLAAFLHEGGLPVNLPGLTPGSARVRLPERSIQLGPGATVLKLSAGMGGHNASILLRRTPRPSGD